MIHLKQIRDSLREVVEAYDLDAQIPNDQLVLNRHYRRLLDEPRYDRVLRYCLALHSDLAMDEEEWPKMFAQYAEKFRTYERSLGPVFHESLRNRLEYHRYILNENSTALADWDAFERVSMARRRAGPDGLLTGFARIDRCTGGLKGVTELAGETGSGKTTLALNLAVGALSQRDDVGVLFLSLEQRKAQIYDKLRSLVSGVAYQGLCDPRSTAAGHDLIASSNSRLKEQILPRLRVVDGYAASDNRPLIDRICEHALRFVKTSKVRSLLLIIDRIQKLNVDSPVVGFQNDDPEFGSLSDLQADNARIELLAALHRRLSARREIRDAAILGLSRVTKGEQRKKLTLDDVPGSSEVVFAADCVLLLERDKKKEPTEDVTPTLLDVAKVRDGGERGEVRLGFQWRVSRFVEAEEASTRPEKGAAVPVAANGSKRFRGA